MDQYNEYDFKVFDLLADYKGPRATNGSTTLNENIAGMYFWFILIYTFHGIPKNVNYRH